MRDVIPDFLILMTVIDDARFTSGTKNEDILIVFFSNY